MRAPAGVQSDFEAILPGLSLSAAGIQRVVHVKFAASSVLPVPLYLATSGYGHSGRVRTTSPPGRGELLYLDATI